jgi:hypothetical protein
MIGEQTILFEREIDRINKMHEEELKGVKETFEWCFKRK